MAFSTHSAGFVVVADVVVFAVEFPGDGLGVGQTGGLLQVVFGSPHTATPQCSHTYAAAYLVPGGIMHESSGATIIGTGGVVPKS